MSRLFFVNRRVRPLPPEPPRFMVVRSIITFILWQDRREECQ